MADDRQARVFAVGTAMQRYQRSVQAFDDEVGRRLGLGPADLRCLDWLADGPKTAGQLSSGTGLRPAATTALIDRLAARGLVERIPSETDRRRVLVRMTEQGQRETAAFYWPLVEEGQGLMDALGDAELELMRTHLEAITALTDRHRARLTEGG
ncbi:MarR family winged helix-turn-helix transcriptional regulator [Schumannella soli]|uniref:MarR family transcriptional regulator n=1 Tax=Schumannella soli TaxID=2590779 RepID=A0A506XNB1_9MICO|nr:MarR family transcriptional regulator [Schumannella soli]TPW74071.1 MarR family transcriptional regulator [Schumannella soli]